MAGIIDNVVSNAILKRTKMSCQLALTGFVNATREADSGCLDTVMGIASSDESVSTEYFKCRKTV